MSENKKILVIGIGNEYRSDDAAGLVIARQLRERTLEGTVIIEQGGDGGSLIEKWQDADAVILIDAVASGNKPGTIFRFDARAERIPAKFFNYSTHAFSIAETIELAKAMQQLPPQLVVYGIEGENFAPGMKISKNIEPVIEEVANRIDAEICSIIHPHTAHQ